MNSCYLHCARSIHINTDRKQLKQVLHFRFSFEPRFSEVDKSLFLAPPLRTTSCNVHYSGSILYDNERESNLSRLDRIPPARTRNSHISTPSSLPGGVYSVYIKTYCPVMPLSYKQAHIYRENSRRV